VTGEMRRYMPNACGGWADKIDAALGCPKAVYLRRHHVIQDSEVRRYGPWVICYDADSLVHWSFSCGNHKATGVSLNDCLNQIDDIECASNYDAYGRTGNKEQCRICCGSGMDYAETCLACGGFGWVNE